VMTTKQVKTSKCNRTEMNEAVEGMDVFC